MTHRIFWIDAHRWNELLIGVGLEPMEGLEEVEAPAPAAQATHWVERLLVRCLDLPGVSGAFLVDRYGLPLAQAGIEAGGLGGLAADLLEVCAARRRAGAPVPGMAIFGLAGRDRLHLLAADAPGEGCALALVADRSLTDRELFDLRLRLNQALKG
jgi:hypothetical protein